LEFTVDLLFDLHYFITDVITSDSGGLRGRRANRYTYGCDAWLTEKRGKGLPQGAKSNSHAYFLHHQAFSYNQLAIGHLNVFCFLFFLC